MRVHPKNQEYATINEILYKNINTGIIANVNLKPLFQIVEINGTYNDKKETSQIVYGLTKEYLISLAESFNEESILFRSHYTSNFLLINVKTKEEISLGYFEILPDDTKETNYSEFDGIKFKLKE